MYELSRHRFCELKHFCLQYPEWKQRYLAVKGKAEDPTADTAVKKTEYMSAIELIETTARATSLVYAKDILRSVTQDKSYTELKSEGMTLDKATFDDLRSRFFFLLSLRR